MDDIQAKTEVTIDLLKRKLEEVKDEYEEAVDEYILKHPKEETWDDYIPGMQFKYLIILRRKIAMLNEKIDQLSFREVGQKATTSLDDVVQNWNKI